MRAMKRNTPQGFVITFLWKACKLNYHQELLSQKDSIWGPPLLRYGCFQSHSFTNFPPDVGVPNCFLSGTNVLQQSVTVLFFVFHTGYCAGNICYIFKFYLYEMLHLKLHDGYIHPQHASNANPALVKLFFIWLHQHSFCMISWFAYQTMYPLITYLTKPILGLA